MATAARLPFAADRYTSCVRTIRFRGLDLTGVAMRLQVRLRPDTPGVPRIDLGVVTNGNQEGLRIVSVDTVDGVRVTTVNLRINKTTMASLPYAGEIGDVTVLAYDLVATFGIDDRRLAYGEFVVIAGVTGADGAPIDRPTGDEAVSTVQPWAVAELAFAGDTVEITIDGDGLMADAVASMIASSEARTLDLVRATRDPWIALTQKILRGAFGLVTYTKGLRNTVSRPTLIIASVGNSHMVGQGAPAGPLMTPGDMLMLAFRVLLPDWDVVHDNYGTPGSWTSQIDGQINGFTRAPDIVLLGDPMNDGTANIFMGYQGFVGPNNTYGGYEAALANVFERLRIAGAAVINLTGHQPHPTRAKANGRLSVTPEVLMTWPQPSLIAYYLLIVFTKVDQRITAYAVNAQGERIPVDLFNAYGGQMFGAGQYLLEFNPFSGATGALHHALEIASNGSWVRVDGTILADKDDGVTSVRQGNFDNETQVWPPLSRAIVQRDYSGTGALVDVSWRHWELANASRRIALRSGVVTVDTDAIFGRQVRTNADYDTLFAQPVGDDYHSAAWFTMLPAPFHALARDVVNGTIPGNRIYS